MSFNESLEIAGGFLSMPEEYEIWLRQGLNNSGELAACDLTRPPSRLDWAAEVEAELFSSADSIVPLEAAGSAIQLGSHTIGSYAMEEEQQEDNPSGAGTGCSLRTIPEEAEEETEDETEDEVTENEQDEDRIAVVAVVGSWTDSDIKSTDFEELKSDAFEFDTTHDHVSSVLVATASTESCDPATEDNGEVMNRPCVQQDRPVEIGSGSSVDTPTVSCLGGGYVLIEITHDSHDSEYSALLPPSASPKWRGPRDWSTDSLGRSKMTSLWFRLLSTVHKMK